jgi:hypothetical protein
VTARDFTKLGVALLLGAAIAFPAGMMVAGWRSEPGRARPTAPRGGAEMRDMFSPSVRSDPWFLQRQREGIEALERYCAQTGESCPEARAARRRLAEIEAAN